MAFNLLSKFSHFRKQAFSLPKAHILYHLRAPNDANVMLSGWAADARTFSSQQRDGTDDDGSLRLCNTVEGESLVLVNKGETSLFKVGEQRDGTNNDGALRLCDSVEGESLVLVKKGETSLFKVDGVDDNAALKSQVSKKRNIGKTSKKEEAARSVLSLCKAERLTDIVRFPPVVLDDKRRLRQLFDVYVDEFNIRFEFEGEEEVAFINFKYNLFLINSRNGPKGKKYRLTDQSHQAASHYIVYRGLIKF